MSYFICPVCNDKLEKNGKTSKDIESFGTGLKRIADVCKSAGVRYEFKNQKAI